VIDPRVEYQSRLAAWRGRISALDRLHFAVSNGRLVVALVGVVLLWQAFVRESISAVWPAIVAIAFLALVVIHARVLQRSDRARRAEQWYVRGTRRLDGEWIGRGRDGGAFGADHPYARDLDLFGRGSLFELLNTANSEAGEDTLADWLRAGAPLDEVTARQTAVAELRGNVAFREELAVLAAESEVSRTGRIAEWAAAPPVGLGRFASTTFLLCSLVAAVIAAFVFSERIGGRWLVLWLIVESAVALAWHARVRQVLVRIATPDRDLALVSDLLARIERESFAAPRLTAIASALITQGVPPSRRIAQLRRLVSWLDSARNQIFAPFALALLLPQQLAVAIDRWHARYGPAVLEWLKAIGELEALAALGTYAFEHPHDPFPALVDAKEEGPLFEAAGLGHPLMLEGACVRNDLRLAAGHSSAPQILVISGSNMSGKSTLLRSVGANVVLALAGAPVRSTRLRLSQLAIGATLKVEDSLQEGHSRFYAEILRIRDIVEAARGPVPLLFLLDEILHGTNSYDRRIGAEAIVRALAAAGAIGLVTTHDLALTELPDRLGPAAVNMHFEDRLENGRMVFDYQMRPGVVEHSNALALMRAVGLEV
jgi:hypothetical protein